MRLLKFRVWNEWEHKMEIPDNIANGIDGNKYQVMQFTGLFDKQGKEIYEGDIVQNYALKDAVIFDAGVFTLRRSGLDKFGAKQPLAVHAELEVIGNIYENPELLLDK
jgi:hypothetical protein